MSRMIELIRQAAVPANLMRAAAHGALSLPAAEMLEVLVALTANPVFGSQARLTLADWDEAATREVVGDPAAPEAVLEYFSAPENQRQPLLAALLENPSVGEFRLLAMARAASAETLPMLLASRRVRSLPAVLEALLPHPGLTAADLESIKADLLRSGELPSDAPGQEIFEPELSQYLQEHAAEIQAEEGKAFSLIGGSTEEQEEIAAVQARSTAGLAARALATPSSRQSPVQKIAALKVGERVQLALKGNRDERLILVRDGAKVVSNAVLESPRMTDSEIELYASMRNVGENVLRGIAGKRKFMRNYALKRLLTANPRCPIDVALPLTKELLVMDLKNLSMNKNVTETVRRFAWKVWRDKTKAR